MTANRRHLHSDQKPGMPHSTSEPSVGRRMNEQLRKRKSLEQTVFTSITRETSREQSGDNEGEEYLVRGRSITRDQVPERSNASLEATLEVSTLTSPNKRSRSPVKRIFGDRKWLKKSESAREFSNMTSKEPVSKDSSKRVGDKITWRVENIVSDLSFSTFGPLF
jgi:hypothetical protein